ncbi:MAG: hypothetical protein FWD99_06600 [Oscillospiraceae bacterium]|nr:hypothetical protein [Oscillospiraceae bacterium]
MEHMREVGFRTKVFGGFNRNDVLEHMKGVYYELWLCREENEALRERCEALETQLQAAGHMSEPQEEADVPESAATEPTPTPQAELEAMTKAQEPLEGSDSSGPMPHGAFDTLESVLEQAAEPQPEPDVGELDRQAEPDATEPAPDTEEAEPQAGNDAPEPESEPEKEQKPATEPTLHSKPSAPKIQTRPVEARHQRPARVKVRKKRF